MSNGNAFEKDASIPREVDVGPGAQDVEIAQAASKFGTRPQCFKSTWTEIVYVAMCTMSIAMNALQVGSITVITEQIGLDLRMTQPQITWIASAATLANGAFLLLFARFADLFGRKAIFICSLFAFSVVCVGAGFSQNGITLDVLNGVLGLTSAAAVPAAVGSLSLTYGQPSKRKNIAFACFNGGNPLGYVFGMIMSGIAAQIFNWRASFFLLAIIYLLVAVAAVFTVPADPTEKLPWNRETVRRFDIVGAVLTIGGFGTFTASLTLGGAEPGGWRTPSVLALLLIGVVCIAAFIVWDFYYKYPLVPMSIWRDRDFSLLVIILILGFLAFPPSLFWITLYMQRFWTGSALHVAAYMLPAAVSGILANVFTGAVLHKISNKLLMGLACFLYTVSFMLLALNRTGDSYWPFVFPGLLLITWGVDPQFNVVNMYVISSMPAAHQSIAGGIVQMVSRLGSAVGFGVTTAIFNAVASRPPPTSGYEAYNPSAPYAATFWFSMACTGLSLLLVPFLKIGTQGHTSKDTSERKSDEQETSAASTE